MITVSGSGINSTVFLADIRSGGKSFKKDTSTTHSEIKTIQNALLSLGFNPNGCDGIYGAGTVRAVKAFQHENSLTADGLFGKQSLLKLESYTGTLTGDDSITPTLTSVQHGAGAFKIGHSGNAINQIRSALIRHGISCTVTGSFDTSLSNAIKQFQSRHGLTVDGVVGQVTLALLLDTTLNSSTIVSGNHVILSAGKLAKVGFKGAILCPECVTALNNALNHYNINSLKRIHHFLAQVMAETGSGYYLTESGYLAGEMSGASDYDPYYGAGLLHLTWQSNYNLFRNHMAARGTTDTRILTPNVYATQHVAFKYPCESAGWFWNERNINSTVDANDSANNIVANVTRLVSGTNCPTSYITQRQAYYQTISTKLTY